MTLTLETKEHTFD